MAGIMGYNEGMKGEKDMTKLFEARYFDGRASGILGVVNAIKWYRWEWFRLCWKWKKIVNEGDIWNWKTGH